MSERESAGEGETLGVMVGASIRELGTRDQTQNGFFFCRHLSVQWLESSFV